jgi:hypothetical protein
MPSSHLHVDFKHIHTAHSDNLSTQVLYLTFPGRWTYLLHTLMTAHAQNAGPQRFNQTANAPEERGHLVLKRRQVLRCNHIIQEETQVIVAHTDLVEVAISLLRISVVIDPTPNQVLTPGVSRGNTL